MNVLIVDDDVVDREHIKRTLRKSAQNCHFVETESVNEGLEAFRLASFDVVLLDYRMPQRDGIELLLELKSEKNGNSVAIIMLSNSEEEALALECIKAGAQDFLLKIEVTASKLNRAILQAQVRFELEQKLFNSYKLVKNIAEHDTLTGLDNRYAFEEALKLRVAKNTRFQESIALLLFDLDHFKYVNDTHGHDTGDELLRQVAKKISKCLRENEIFARIGGDEFAIILSNTFDAYLINNVARRILNSLTATFHIKGIEIGVSASIGIAVYPDNTINPDELFKFADIAMYRAKKLGRNQICYFESEMQKQFLHRYKIEHALVDGIVKDQFRLHYQPVFSAKERKLVGFEALIRWFVDDTLLMPDEFVGIAEESGAILTIGRWVIEQAIYQLSIWQQVSNQSISMSINLSAKQLVDEKLLTCIERSLAKHNVSAKNIEFELTETTLLESNDAVIMIMNAIRDLGSKIALDDFGTGFSSVSHLQDFPIDTVKIDKSLLLASSEDKTVRLIKGLSYMLHSLDLAIVAEGVETEESLKLCQSINVDRIQGYLLSKPLEVHAIDERFFRQ
jgi:diguanylate cyclase (GGDEF)-like protein